MKPYTKEFIKSLTNLLEEYNAKIELEGDRHTGVFWMTLEVKNPQLIHEYFDDYPMTGDLYSQYDWVEIGNLLNINRLKELIK